MSRLKQRKTIDIDKANLDRFEEIYPGRGSFTWFVNECLEQFVEAHEITPTEQVRDAVNTVLFDKD